MKVAMPEVIGTFPVIPQEHADCIRIEGRSEAGGSTRIIVPASAEWFRIAQTQYVVRVRGNRPGVPRLRHWHIGGTDAVFVAKIAEETANQLMNPDLTHVATSALGQVETDVRQAASSALDQVKGAVDSTIADIKKSLGQ